MKPLFLLTVALSNSLALSQLILPAIFRGSTRQPLPEAREQQRPIQMDPAGPGPAMPPGTPHSGGSGDKADAAPGHGSVMLSDIMGRDKSINIFAGLIRDVESASRRLEDSSKNSTVLAPLNSRIEALPRKPWEDPADYDGLGAEAYEGQDGEERAQRNLRRFVEAHLIPSNPWPEKEKVKALTGDRDIWWENREGVRVIMPDNIEVVSLGGTVANGELWVVKGVRNYA